MSPACFAFFCVVWRVSQKRLASHAGVSNQCGRKADPNSVGNEMLKGNDQQLEQIKGHS